MAEMMHEFLGKARLKVRPPTGKTVAVPLETLESLVDCVDNLKRMHDHTIDLIRDVPLPTMAQSLLFALSNAVTESVERVAEFRKP
jgi:hypothetical protein